MTRDEQGCAWAEWLLKGGRRLRASCCWRWPGTAGRTEQCLQHLPGREMSS